MINMIILTPDGTQQSLITHWGASQWWEPAKKEEPELMRESAT